MGTTPQILGTVFGCLLIVWVGLRGIVFAARAATARARRRRRVASERIEFCDRVRAAARAARAAKAISDWEGWRPFRVAAIVDESIDVKSYYFVPVDGRPLLPFAPGQHLTFRLPVDGQQGQLVRCYSLSDRPRQDYYRSTIKRIRGCPASGSPAGRASNFFHERVGVGDVIDVRAPAGTFLIDPLARDPVVLIGAGIGVTPLVSMLEALVQSGRPRDVYAFFGFRNGTEHPFKNVLARLAEAHPWIHLHTSYSAPVRQDVLYRDYNCHGRISIEQLRAVLPSNNFQFYVCGPSGLMESLVPGLWNWGVPEAHVHFETFGPASVAGTAHRQPNTIDHCTVRFERSDCGVVWDGTAASLLEIGESAGIALSSGCRAGNCGECMLAIRDGAVIPLKKPGIAVPSGHCLSCISVPAGDLVLEA